MPTAQTLPPPAEMIALRDPSKEDSLALSIDEAAAGAFEIFKSAKSFSQEIKLAQAIQKLRAMLTPAVMAPVMELMNTDIGFLTDRDPKRAKSGENIQPYSVDVVRECFIQSRMRGFRLVDNEWNIIAGKFYGARNGFKRRITDGVQFPLLSNFTKTIDVPRVVEGKGAVVKCRASWLWDGRPQTEECEFAVKVNAMMGADAITGKAERKLYHAVHDRLLCVQTPGADEGEGAVVDVASERVPEAKKPAFADQPAPAPAPPPQSAGHRKALVDFLVRNEIPFTKLQEWVIETAWEPGWDSIGSVDEVSETSAARLLRSQGGLLRVLKSPQPAQAPT